MSDFEKMKLIDKIVLNGKVGHVFTNDNNSKTIGVLNVIKRVTFAGEELVDEGSGFPLTKEMEDKIGWCKYFASVKFVTGNEPIDPTKVDEKIIESYYGDAEAKYRHHYSDFTGYLWTDEGFKVGGHDIPNILSGYLDRFIHMEIEIYK
ncbi:hypothetical protein IEN91_05040 [Bacillus velezensis]|uniref:hypothetical protein n=1 Tax=Bacillus velezensis TaxID=492670 RepID=UPI0018C59159|nr:hypothetical protein [Bacillus velezensis]QPK89806.1 hypothetical protein IEN91_05040 [Bacillus velezensis]